MSDSASTSTASAASTATDRSETDILYETGPSLKPAIVRLAIALLVSVLLVGYLLTHPLLLGSRQGTEIATYVVAVIALVLLIRYAVRVYLLKRYRYTVTDEAVRWKYSVFYKTRERELPFAKIRGHEFQQSRLQAILGFGTVAFLSGGTNQSLGFLEFEDVAAPGEIRSIVREQLEE